MPDQILITRPDDWHVHLRDGNAMADVVGATAREFARAIVMPNLKPPVVDVKKAKAYRDRILAALPKRAKFEPLMTLYLTDGTSADEIARAVATDSAESKALEIAGSPLVSILPDGPSMLVHAIGSALCV